MALLQIAAEAQFWSLVLIVGGFAEAFILTAYLCSGVGDTPAWNDSFVAFLAWNLVALALWHVLSYAVLAVGTLGILWIVNALVGG